MRVEDANPVNCGDGDGEHEASPHIGGGGGAGVVDLVVHLDDRGDGDRLFVNERIAVADLVAAFRRTWRDTPSVKLTVMAGTVLALMASSAGMNLSMNFFLSRIVIGSSGYASNIAPAIVWLVLTIIPTAAYHSYRRWWPWYLTSRRTPNGAVNPHLWGLRVTLLGLGIVDAFGGLTATYAAPNVPVFLQTLLLGWGVIWTFGLTRWLIPVRPKPQLTPATLVAYLLTIAGTVIAAVPFRDSITLVNNVVWLFIFAIAALLPVVYNVLQGRFMRLVDAVVLEDQRAAYESVLPAATSMATASGSTGGNVTQSMCIDDEGGAHHRGGASGRAAASLAKEKLTERQLLLADDGLRPHNSTPPHQRQAAAVGNVLLDGTASSESMVLAGPGAPVALNNTASSHNNVVENSSITGASFVARGSAAKPDTLNHFSVRMTMLLGDTFVMLVVIIIAFPLDFAPWYGDHPRDPSASWRGFTDAVRCILWECDSTLIYFLLYSACFWLNHFVFAHLNYLSTTVTSFCAALSLPIQLLLLYFFPVLDVWGTATPLGYTLPCLATTTLAAVLFFLSEQARDARHHREVVRRSNNSSAGRPDR